MPEQLTTTATASAVAETFGPAQAAPKTLRVGKPFTAQYLLAEVKGAAAEVAQAAGRRIAKLVTEFNNLPFTTGQAIFKQAKKDAADDKATLVRLSEANAIFTSVSIAKVPASNYAGMGWSPAVKAARDALKAAGITVAGNERTSEEEREAAKAKALSRDVAEATTDRAAQESQALGRDLTAEELAKIMAEERAKANLRKASLAFPDAIVAIGKAMDAAKDALDCLKFHAENESTLWATLPDGMAELYATMIEYRQVAVDAAAEITAVREQAKDQKAHERAEAKLEKAQAEVGRNIRRAERKAA